MTESAQHPNVFAFDLYQRSQLEMRTLKSKLPEDSVVGLAKEVLLRVAERADLNRVAEYANQIEQLCRALIAEDADAGAAFIRDLRADGASPEEVYLSYLAGAARMLGEWWVEDRVSFSEVTIGTSRMYGIMRAMRHLFMPAASMRRRSAVFAPVPGETHTLGVRMAADLFRKEGWDIDLKIARTHDELLREIGTSPAMVIGLSTGGEHSIDALARLVVALRIINPAALILVSGQLMSKPEDLVSMMGVDAAAKDIPSARAALERLWEQAHAQPS